MALLITCIIIDACHFGHSPQKAPFVRAVSTKSIHLFLEWFTETQMFEVFITEKLEAYPNLPEGMVLAESDFPYLNTSVIEGVDIEMDTIRF